MCHVVHRQHYSLTILFLVFLVWQIVSETNPNKKNQILRRAMLVWSCIAWSLSFNFLHATYHRGFVFLLQFFDTEDWFFLKNIIFHLFRYDWDGLNNLTYKLSSRDVLERFTILHVNLETITKWRKQSYNVKVFRKLLKIAKMRQKLFIHR